MSRMWNVVWDAPLNTQLAFYLIITCDPQIKSCGGETQHML